MTHAPPAKSDNRLRWSCALGFLMLTFAATCQAAQPEDGAAGQMERIPTPEAVGGARPDEFVIDLPTALRLAEQSNPRLGRSRAAIGEAVAFYNGARVMLIPDLNAGTNYHLHNGVLQTSFGEIRSLTEQSIYVGGGARTLAAETVAIPMVRIFSHLGDAIYTPLSARQEVSASRSRSEATENLVLLDVASRYLNLAGADARVDAYRRSLEQFQQIEQATAAFVRAGQGRDGDYKRARADALLLRVEQIRAQAEVRVAANELARLLRLDPATSLTTTRSPIEAIVIVDPELPVERLGDIALRRRPELLAQSASIGAAEERYRQEKTRPLFPLISLGFSTGGFGGGSNRTDLNVTSFFQRFSGREDFDALAVWTLQNMGAGNAALAARARAERDGIISQRGVISARVLREVGEAHAATVAGRQRIQVAQRQLAAAERGANEELIRTRGGEGLPIEALNSVGLLATARQDAITAVVEYDIAEFRLFQAIGEHPTSQTSDPKAPPAASSPTPK